MFFSVRVSAGGVLPTGGSWVKPLHFLLVGELPLVKQTYQGSYKEYSKPLLFKKINRISTKFDKVVTYMINILINLQLSLIGALNS